MMSRTAMAVTFSLLVTATAQADADITVSGNLLPPVCTVHNGSGDSISVDFSDEINISRIDGARYQKTVTYQIDCEDDGYAWPLRLRLTGTEAWNNQTLQSDRAHLGLRFELGGNPVVLGAGIPISSRTSPPTLTVVPVKDPVDDPLEGAFEATANLLAEYY
jgi:type 1 fimbria pilin